MRKTFCRTSRSFSNRLKRNVYAAFAAGIITAAIGLGATIVVLVMAMDKIEIFPYITPALITFLVGIGVIVNGLVFTVPRKQLPGDAYDALSQKVLDSGNEPNSLRSPSAASNLTNELAPAPQMQALHH